MKKKTIKILAIESSCDETAAAVIGEVGGKPVILSNVVSSQIDLHAKTGGVVPEVASRAHMEAITPVITEALMGAKRFATGDRLQVTGSKYNEAIDYLKSEITHIAVTYGPGLIGSLLVGFNAAKTLAYALDKPIIPIHHIAGHIASALVGKVPNSSAGVSSVDDGILASQASTPQDDRWDEISNFNFPLLALVVSGGHTSIIMMKDHGQHEVVGQTLDDAAGEAYDKVAKLLDLGYPGGPAVSKLAEEYRSKFLISNFECRIGEKAENNLLEIRNSKLEIDGIAKQRSGSSLPLKSRGTHPITFPRPLLNDRSFNFSFSGLKTAVLREVLSSAELGEERKSEIAAAFEEAAVDVLVQKTLKAVLKYHPQTVVLAGGVAANTHLRNCLISQISTLNPQIDLRVPPLQLCGDNAAMIGLAAYYQAQCTRAVVWSDIKVDSNAKL